LSDRERELQVVKNGGPDPRSPPRYFLYVDVLTGEEFFETTPFFIVYVEKYFLVASHKFPLFFFLPIFPIIEKGERIGLYRHFQILSPPGLT
jgi:hypothetical protein